MKKALILMVVFMLLAAGGAFAQGARDPGGSGNGTESAATESVTTLKGMWMYSWWQPRAWGNEPVTQRITDKTGVRIDFSAPAGDGNEKASLMLVTGDYPDLMWMDRGAVFQQYIQNDALYAIDVLAQKYGYDDFFGKSIPQVVADNMRSADGHIYGIPNWFDEDGSWSSSATVNVRQDLHEILGRPALATIADLHAYLRAVKAGEFRTDAGKVYPLGLDWRLEWLPVIANLWGGKIDKSLKYLDEETGKIQFYLRSDAAYESLKWLNTLYHEGLIDPENFSYQLQQRDEAYNTGKFAVIFGYFFDLWDPNRVLQSQKEGMYYAAVDAPQGTPGVPALMDSYSVLGWNVAAITKNCKDPEAAMRFFDFYMSEEGQILSFFGIEGETWSMQEGKPILMPGVYEAKIADWDGYGKKTGVRYLDLNQSQKYNWEKDMEVGQRKADRAIATKYGFNGTQMSQLVLDGKSEAGKAFANIEASLLAEVTRLVLVDDPKQFDAKYREMMQNFDTLKLPVVEAEWNRLYNR